MSRHVELASNWQVVVIGGGPAGAAATIGCARAGLRVLQVDEKAFPRRKVCGGCLNQVSLELLEGLLGSDHPLWQQTQPLGGFSMLHRGREFRFTTPPGRAVDRGLLDEALVKQGILAGSIFCDKTRADIGHASPAGREVLLHSTTASPTAGNTGKAQQTVAAELIVLAAGLGNRGWQSSGSTGSLDRLRHIASPKSRVGIEAILPDFPSKYADGTIHMVVGRDGYVGLTEISGRRLHVAAAVDRGALKRVGPPQLIRALLKQAGAPPLDSLEQANWRGTPPLTAQPEHLGAERVLLVGDAAGYVEPFTGEGIRWALESGLGIVPFAKQVCGARSSGSWDDGVVRDWELWYERTIRREQRLCRRLTSGLKKPLVRWVAHQALLFQPRCASAIIDRLNGTKPS